MIEKLPVEHPRDLARPAFSQAMIALLDDYEQRIWLWAQGCEIDGIQQRSQVGDSYNEGQRNDSAKARSALLCYIDSATSENAPAGRVAALQSQVDALQKALTKIAYYEGGTDYTCHQGMRGIAEDAIARQEGPTT